VAKQPKSQPTVLGSQRRMDSVCSMMAHGGEGDFVIAHQDGCLVFSGRKCSCAPSVWRVTRGKA